MNLQRNAVSCHSPCVKRSSDVTFAAIYPHYQKKPHHHHGSLILLHSLVSHRRRLPAAPSTPSSPYVPLRHVAAASVRASAISQSSSLSQSTASSSLVSPVFLTPSSLVQPLSALSSSPDLSPIADSHSSSAKPAPLNPSEMKTRPPPRHLPPLRVKQRRPSSDDAVPFFLRSLCSCAPHFH